MPKKHIVIVGNSGFARECHIMLRTMMAVQPGLEFRGFLSFEGFAADLKELSTWFLGIDDDYRFAPDDVAVIGIADPALRKKAHQKLRSRHVPLFNLIHANSSIDSSSSLGEGNIFGSGCHVSCHCSIGACNVFNGLIHIGHDCTIGDYNFAGPGGQILGNTRIGSGNSIGTSSVLMPHCTIGDNNMIAPLSAVYKGCRDHVYLAGNPAVKIGTKGNEG